MLMRCRGWCASLNQGGDSRQRHRSKTATSTVTSAKSISPKSGQTLICLTTLVAPVIDHDGNF
jgi:hypothetical protein